jgi:hypothetical protein
MHTKGPWKYEYPEHTEGAVVFIENGPSSRDRIGICDIRRPNSPEGKSNGNLIAAAPDLYDACKAVLVDHIHSHTVLSDSMAKVLAVALEKAKGRS